MQPALVCLTGRLPRPSQLGQWLSPGCSPLTFSPYGLYGAFLVKRGRSATFSFLSSFFAFLALSFVRPRRRLSSAPTARCQSRRAQRQSRTARFSAPPGRALSLTDVRTAACCNGRVRLD